MAEPFFRTERLTVGYNGVPLIRDIEIRLDRGRILTLIGPNGSGKSTVLKSITNYLKPLCGAVYLESRAVGGMTGGDLSRLVSVVLTEKPRTELMTCGEVAATGRYPYTGMLGILSEEDRRLVREAMELVDVWALREQDFTEISDGSGSGSCSRGRSASSPGSSCSTSRPPSSTCATSSSCSASCGSWRRSGGSP